MDLQPFLQNRMINEKKHYAKIVSVFGENVAFFKVDIYVGDFNITKSMGGQRGEGDPYGVHNSLLK